MGEIKRKACIIATRHIHVNKQIREAFDLSMSLCKRAGWMSPIMYFIASIGIAFVMWFGNQLIISGQMTSGSFASFVTSI